MTPFVIPSVFTAIDKFSAPLKTMGNSVAGFVGRSERLLGRANAAFNSLISPITNLNKMLRGLGFYIGIYTLIRAFKGALDIMADFQQAQVDIRAVTGNNIPQTKVLANQARELALRYGESATSILATDLALIKMGYSASKASKAAEAILTGSVALKANPEDLAKSVGATMQAFKLPSGSEQMVVDMFAKAADVSALDWKDLQTMLPIAQGAATITGYTLPEMLGLFAAARNAQVHVASGSTAIKNMMVKSGIYDKDLSTMLTKITSSTNQIKTAFKMFGPKTLVTALPLAEALKLGDLDKLIIQLTDHSEGYAKIVARIRLESVRGAQALWSAAYDEFILSIEDGNGPLAKTITNLIKTSSAMLLLWADSDIAKNAFMQFTPEIQKSAERWLFWLKVAGYVTAAVISMKVALILWRAAVIAATIVQGAFSIALGVSAAAGWTNVFALRGNVIALGVLRGITVIATAAQWAFNAAMKANPIVIMATAILGLVSAYRDMNAEINKNQEAQAKLAATKGIKFEKNDPSFGDKLKMMFLPGYSVNTGTFKFSDDRMDKELGYDAMSGPGAQAVNPKVDSNMNIDSLINALKGNINMNINDPGNNVKDVKSDSSWLQPKLSPSGGW
jgi:hypothetical protein